MNTLLLCLIFAGPVPTAPPSAQAAMSPSLLAVDNGAWLTWLEPADPLNPTVAGAGDPWRLRVAFRPHGEDAAWTTPETITQRTDFFINWADVPRLCVAKDGTRFATWLQQSGPGTYAYDIGLARHDAAAWTAMGTLNDDHVLGEHGFVSMVPEGQGVRAFWLDGRAMTGEGHSGHGGGDMSLRTSLVDSKVHESQQLDARVCECCPTNAARMPLGSAVVYRDRGPEEERDIAIVRRVGDGWSDPMPVSIDDWRINGCPVNGPVIAADGARVAVAWYSAGGARPGLQLAWSLDGGTTFGPAHPVDDRDATGRPALVLMPNGAMVCWFDQNASGQWLCAAVMNHKGTLGPVERLARVPHGRRAGMPVAAGLGDHILVAWTAEDRKRGVDALLLPVATFPRP